MQKKKDSKKSELPNNWERAIKLEFSKYEIISLPAILITDFLVLAKASTAKIYNIVTTYNNIIYKVTS